MNISLLDLYIIFLKLGFELLGGGYVIVPLIKKHLIEERKLITEEDIVNFYALSQSIPGVIAANISTFVGYKLRGKRGALIALLGIVTSPIIAIIIVASVMDKLLQLPFIQSVFWGIGVAVVILVYLSIKEMWKQSLTDIFTWIIFISTFVASYFFNISPVFAIIGAMIFGITIKLIQKGRSV